MMDAISVHILSGEQTILETRAEYVNLPTGFGSLGILAGHAPMLCNLEEGVVLCRGSQGTVRVRIGAGIASVEHNELNVLVPFGEILEG